MSTDDHELHPNLADAIGDDAIGAADLDAIARRLSELTSDEEIQPPPASVFAAIEAELGVNVVPLASRRSRRPPLMAAAAAVSWSWSSWVLRSSGIPLPRSAPRR